MTTSTTRRQARALLLVGVALPLLFTAIAAAVQIAWIPELPDPAVTHWSGAGAPDAFGSAWVYPILTVLVGLLLPVMALMALRSVRRGAAGFVTRILAAASLGLSAMMAITMSGSVAIQRGLDDAADAPGVGALIWWSLAALVVFTLAGWFAQPTPAAAVPTAASSPGEPIALGEQERVAWVGNAAATPWLWAVALVPLGAAVWVFFGTSSEDVPTWSAVVLVAVVLFVIGALAMFTSFSVAVDHRGVTVTSTAGWPRLEVALADVDAVAVIDVEPLGQFGGWGLRQVPGATGIVTRRGEGLEVTRASGKRLVVTVDDARTAADLLAGLVARARG